jgi:hypothetical protein
MTDDIGAAVARGLSDVVRECVREELAKHARAKSQPASDGPSLGRVTAVAGELGVCEGSIRKLARQGLITLHRRPGSRLTFVCRREVQAALMQSAQPASADGWAKKKLAKK